MQILILFIRDTINKLVSYPFINRNRKMSYLSYKIFKIFIYNNILAIKDDVEKIEFIRVCLSHEIWSYVYISVYTIKKNMKPRCQLYLRLFFPVYKHLLFHQSSSKKTGIVNKDFSMVLYWQYDLIYKLLILYISCICVVLVVWKTKANHSRNMK